MEFIFYRKSRYWLTTDINYRLSNFETLVDCWAECVNIKSTVFISALRSLKIVSKLSKLWILTFATLLTKYFTLVVFIWHMKLNWFRSLRFLFLELQNLQTCYRILMCYNQHQNFFSFPFSTTSILIRLVNLMETSF